MTLVIGSRVDPTSYSLATKTILDWSYWRESRFVCAANVHMLMEAHDSPDFMQILNQADLVTPDGMPLVWMMRLKGKKDQQRVYGPTLMLDVIEAAARDVISVGFYGSSSAVLESLSAKMRTNFPGLKIGYSFCPPFRELRLEEDEKVIDEINASSTQILFVGLGCPKQEKWMAEHRGKVNAVMLGVGAAFDFHADFKPQAPAWLQQLGLEWLFRLIAEPRRLWKRYMIHNPRFIVLAILDLLGLYRSKNA